MIEIEVAQHQQQYQCDASSQRFFAYHLTNSYVAPLEEQHDVDGQPVPHAVPQSAWQSVYEYLAQFVLQEQIVVEVEVVEVVVDMHSVLAHVPEQPFVLNWLHALSVKQSRVEQLEGQPLMLPV